MKIKYLGTGAAEGWPGVFVIVSIAGRQGKREARIYAPAQVF